jgi:hypothetical protein
MKKYFFIGLLSLSSSMLLSQTIPHLPDSSFESLKLNSSPAFVILGVEPDNIQRPSSPKQFIAGLQNAIVNGKLKPNLAFEFTPFYTVNPKKNDEKSLRFHPEEYLLDDNNVFDNIKKTLSISLATSESDTVIYGNLKAGTGLGLGIRCILVDAERKKGVINDLKKWQEAEIRRAIYQKIAFAIEEETNFAKATSTGNNIIEDFKKGPLLNEAFNGLPYEFACKIVDDIRDEIASDIQANKMTDVGTMEAQFEKKIQKENALQSLYLSKINERKFPFTKEGFMLEFAFGEASVFENNEFKNVKFAKTAFWLTPSYRWNVAKNKQNISLVDFMGVLRYIINNKRDSIDVTDYLDAGVKGQFTHNKLSGSIEFVGRWLSNKPPTVKSKWTYRLATSIDYKINETLTFKFTFGTNFDGNTATYTEPKKMFAIGGLNFGIFK